MKSLFDLRPFELKPFDINQVHYGTKMNGFKSPTSLDKTAYQQKMSIIAGSGAMTLNYKNSFKSGLKSEITSEYDSKDKVRKY